VARGGLMVTTHTYDALVIGAGGAGMRAAIESSQHCRTAVISKLYPTRSHTGAAQGGVCAALGNMEEDSPEWHAFDTVKGGDYLVDQPAAQLMTEEAIDAIYELEHWGLPFNRTPDGKIAQRRFGGHTANHGERPVMRACYAADRTGHMILQTLYQQCVKRDVKFFNEFYCLDLLLDDEGATAGVVAYELATGEIHVFRAKGVLFATGGYGRMFRVTSNAHALTGDGPAVVFRRGLPLEDMEMFQFHPTGLAKLGVLLSEAARGEGGIVLNKDGERFMERYAPTIKDLAPRDMVSRAIYQEIKEGRGAGPNGDWAFLDISHLDPKVIEEKLPDITEFARIYLKVEPTKEPVPIQPTAHYAMGGIPTDVDGRVVLGADETPVPGLYAAGECACVSVHGANRLGTNSLLDIVVFGRRGGADMARYVKGADLPALPEAPAAQTLGMLDAILTRDSGDNGADIRKELQDNMFDLAFVVRTEEGLSKMQEILGNLRERHDRVAITDKGSVYNTDLMEAVEVGFLLDCAEALVVSARARTESRGGHYRDDHPLRDDANWLKHTLAYRNDDGSIRLDFKPVKMGPYVPMERKY
jgi:succinate dehydrogenase / fumarate reductase flavoprotein subunit